MKKQILDLKSTKEPMKELCVLLKIDEKSIHDPRTIFLEEYDPIVIEVRHRKEGMERFPEFTDYLEELYQKSKTVFIIWGAKEEESRIMEELRQG
ncbi:hypothetical protein [Dubosiella newyorkensis]|uniref:hypothetical protein n=1 Tax=Dubosiella newyorkensis TaxID=1862672 RepID=UPI002731EC5A|nr:hypothetical protein [Dubosiella newyorkensis]